MAQLEELAAGIAGMLSERFGGSTSYPATGYFGKQRETIQVIECFCGEDAWQASSAYLFSVVKALAQHCDQEAIACSLDGHMILVEPGEESGSVAADPLIGKLLSQDLSPNS